MKFSRNIHLIASLKPQVLIAKIIKETKNYGLNIVEINEEEGAVRLIIPLKMYPIIPEIVERYCSYVEYQVISRARHDLSATKLKKIYRELKNVENVKCWLIEPPKSYARILGLHTTTHGLIFIEIYPARASVKGKIMLKYLGEKTTCTTTYFLTVTVSHTFFTYISREKFYNTVEKATKSFILCEKVLKNLASKL